MTWFQQWRQWAAPLPDGPFGLAWFALGAYEAASIRSGGLRQRELMQRDAQFPAPRRAHVLDVITRAVDAAARAGAPLTWSFPDPFLNLSPTAPQSAALLSPQGWAEVAQTVIDRVLKLRHRDKVKALRVLPPPTVEPAGPWIAALRSASGMAVSQHIEAPKADLFFGWPFRFGTFGGLAAKAAKDALRYWPSNRLARAIALSREDDNCDLLIHVGDSAELVAQLMAQPTRIKADLVLLVGDVLDTESMDERKLLLISETAAGGIAVVRWMAMEDLVGALNALMNEISHANTLDVALHAAFPPKLGPLLMWMTDELASMNVRSVARRLNERLKSMAPGTKLDLSRLRPDLIQRPPPERAGSPTPLGRNPFQLPSPSPAQQPTRRLRIRRGTQPTTEPPPQVPAVPPDVAFSLPDLSPAEPTPVVVPPEFELRTEAMTFEAESGGASDLVEVAEVVEGALEPRETEEARATRYLQQRSSIVLHDGNERPALAGFVAGATARVVLRIGAAGKGWQSLFDEFPTDQLPPQADRHRLRVWLTEPDQLAEPLRGQIWLPRDGDSTECTLEFTPRLAGRFDGRVSVLHRGRVLQTAALRARILAPQEAWLHDDWADAFAVETDGAPRLVELAGVRQRLGDLGQRRPFDLAFVTNHTETGQPRLVRLSDKRAWIVDTAGAQDTMAEINAELSRVALRVADYKDGLEGPNGLKALIKLAQCGAYLKVFLVDEQLDRQGTNSAIAKEEYVQIVSLRSDAAIPFEFIYELDAPHDDAHACPHWQSAVKAGACPGTCPGDASKRVCPMGFWGLRKVIERHHITPELDQGGKEFFLQSEPGRGSPALKLRGCVLLARSHRVTDDAMKPVQDKLVASEGVTILPVTSWEDWKTAVETKNPGFILSMPHTDGKGASVSLEISKQTLKTIHITAQHVCPTKESKSPLVALLGCDIVSSAESYTRHVAVFRAKGAAVVIGTIATVFGGHAAAVAEMLSDELLRKRAAPFRLGEVIRDIKRRCLLDKQLMPLCIVAYGDADWLISN